MQNVLPCAAPDQPPPPIGAVLLLHRVVDTALRYQRRSQGVPYCQATGDCNFALPSNYQACVIKNLLYSAPARRRDQLDGGTVLLFATG